MLEKIKKFIAHNDYVLVSIVFATIMLFWVYGCQSKTASPFDPTKKITRAELNADIKYYVDKAAIAYNDLDQRDAFKNEIFNALVAYSSGQGVNPIGVLTTLGGIVGLGTAATYRKKNTLIASQKTTLKAFAAQLTLPNTTVVATYENSNAGTSTPVA